MPLERQARKRKFSRWGVGAVTVLGLLAALGAALLRPQPDPFAGNAVIDPPFTPLTYSVHAFLWWDENHAGGQLAMLNRVLNFSHVKQTFAWRDLEPRPGEWDFSQADRLLEQAAEHEIQVIARLGQVPEWAATGTVEREADIKHDYIPSDLGAWANYCGQVAQRYEGQIVAYQIWNEPNLAREWSNQRPDAAHYVEVLAACSEAIRAVDDEAILISAGLAPTLRNDDVAQPDDVYLDAMYRANFQQYIDVVGVHAPGFGQPPQYGPDDAAADGRHRSTSFRRVEDLRKIMLLHGDAARQMAILEFGYTTDEVNDAYAWYAVDEETQAQYIVEAYEYAALHWRPWVGLMSLIFMPNPEWTPADEEWWWSIAEPTGRTKPAFTAIARMTRYCGEKIVEGWPRQYGQEEYLERRDTCS